MSKLDYLRKWLSLEESAFYLERMIGEKVAVTDVLRFALDGHLTLSVNLQSPKMAKNVKTCKIEMQVAAQYKEVYIYNNWNVYIDEVFSPNRLIDFAMPITNELTKLSGVLDTPLFGIERIHAEEQYCSCLGLPKPSRKQEVIRGMIVSCGSLGTFQIQEFIDVDRELTHLHAVSTNADDAEQSACKQIISLFESIKSINVGDANAYQRYIPISIFPDDVYFVVRTANLEKLVKVLNSTTVTNKPKQSKKTENSQAKFIKSLLTLMYDEEVASNSRKHIDGKMAQIRSDLESKGLHCPSGVTVENWLSDID
ncbi:hypothetical protein [Serratia quinivorans]